MAEDQGDQWSGERVQRWLDQADALDRQLAPVTNLLFEGASLSPGERVLDVGCGSGPTTRAAATAVGSDGWVGGLDISGAMLGAAASVPVPPPAAPIEWIEADAVTWTADISPVDVVISRFGVMFFDDPAAAFANLARATRSGGRLCWMVWDQRDRSDLFQVPLAATVAVLEARGMTVESLPTGGGAFSLSDSARVEALLGDAGWSDVTSERHSVQLRAGGGADPQGAAAAVAGIGPSRVLLTDAADDLRAEAVEAIAATLADHVDAAGEVVLGGSVIRITANRA